MKVSAHAHCSSLKTDLACKNESIIALFAMCLVVVDAASRCIVTSHGLWTDCVC